MILYSLRCDAGHEIEAWFRDGATYERQHARGQVVCPECGSNAVEKAPMAPRLGRPRAADPSPPPTEPAGPPVPPSPAELRRALQLLRRQVEATCEHVGPKFAEEARKIHRNEAKARGIYGEATEAESRSLADDGIEVARLPWVPSSDA
ncbi:MAG: DUF1178 family protein [Stellaceae bacterium]